MVIGVYDSGLGGLSVWRELINLNVSLIYFGDTAHAPYGEKTASQLQEYFWEISDFFQSKGCKAIVIACNTASAMVLPPEENFPIPVFGIIEAGVQSSLAVCKGRLGVLATRGTVESGVYQQAFKKARPEWQVFAQSAPRLATLVERGEMTEPSTKQAVQEYLTPLLEQDIDTLLLGCTHYPFLRPLIEEFVGPNVQIVDPAATLAQYVSEWLHNQKGVIKDNSESSRQFWVSAHPERFRELAQSLLKMEIPEVNIHHMSS